LKTGAPIQSSSWGIQFDLVTAHNPPSPPSIRYLQYSDFHHALDLVPKSAEYFRQRVSFQLGDLFEHPGYLY